MGGTWTGDHQIQLVQCMSLLCVIVVDGPVLQHTKHYRYSLHCSRGAWSELQFVVLQFCNAQSLQMVFKTLHGSLAHIMILHKCVSSLIINNLL